jgi:hypothetical protein
MKPLVTNASDRSQVQDAERKVELKLTEQQRDLIKVLSMPEGRRLFWRILDEAGIFRSIWRSSAEIHYLAGKQDFGHWLMKLVLEEAGEQFYFDMMTENRKDI